MLFLGNEPHRLTWAWCLAVFEQRVLAEWLAKKVRCWVQVRLGKFVSNYIKELTVGGEDYSMQLNTKLHVFNYMYIVGLRETSMTCQQLILLPHTRTCSKPDRFEHHNFVIVSYTIVGGAFNLYLLIAMEMAKYASVTVALFLALSQKQAIKDRNPLAMELIEPRSVNGINRAVLLNRINRGVVCKRINRNMVCKLNCQGVVCKRNYQGCGLQFGNFSSSKESTCSHVQQHLFFVLVVHVGFVLGHTMMKWNKCLMRRRRITSVGSKFFHSLAQKMQQKVKYFHLLTQEIRYFKFLQPENICCI